MSNFLVGKDDSSFLKKRTTWEFEEALNAAQDGDIIEVEKDFILTSEKQFIINKSISIIGLTYIKDENNILPQINARFAIRDNAQVFVQDLWFENNKPKQNIFNINGSSKLVADNIIIGNTLNEGEMYPILYVSQNSSVELTNSTVLMNNNYNTKIHFENSFLYANNVSFSGTISFNKSKGRIENSLLYDNNGFNRLNVRNNSVIELLNSTIRGSDVEKRYPCLYAEKSEIILSSTVIEQNNYNGGALETTDVKLTIDECYIDSIFSSHSEIVIKNDVVVFESINLFNNTRILGNRLFLMGVDNGKINLFAKQNSSIELQEIYFGKLSSPNIKLEKNVMITTKIFKTVMLDEQTYEVLRDDLGNFITTGDANDIVYFGEKTSEELLNEMIGLESVKSDIKEFIAISQMNKLRELKGFTNSNQTLHSLFLGNPGTGKTTVARLLGKLLFEKNVIASDKYIETSRSDLVGKYVGETAQKTKEILESAIGGVLFIDEAYTLNSASENDYGLEAINEILKFMEDHRRDIVIIFAGYTNNMEDFLNMNPGLTSRIPNKFTFEDYTLDQLIQIGINDLKGQKYKVDINHYHDVVSQNYSINNDNSNARWIRNLNEKIIRKLAVRLLNEPTSSLDIITAEDLEAVRIKN